MNTDTLPEFFADFSDAAHDGLVPVMLSEAVINVGDRVSMFDDSDNTCDGVVRRVDKRIAHVEPAWPVLRPTDRVSLRGVDPEDALRAMLRTPPAADDDHRGVRDWATAVTSAAYHSINQFFVVAGAAGFVDFLIEVFEGREGRDRDMSPDGLVVHGDVAIGDSHVMLADATADNPPRPSVSYAYVPDVDATCARAIRLGATKLVVPADRAWGDRVGGFTDPFDNRWWIATPAQWR